jgi:hypothetical protein
VKQTHKYCGIELKQSGFYVPPVNFIHYLVSLCLGVCEIYVFPNPGYKMVFERTLYDLVEKIRGEHFMNVSSRKITRK